MELSAAAQQNNPTNKSTFNSIQCSADFFPLVKSYRGMTQSFIVENNNQIFVNKKR